MSKKESKIITTLNDISKLPKLKLKKLRLDNIDRIEELLVETFLAEQKR